MPNNLNEAKLWVILSAAMPFSTIDNVLSCYVFRKWIRLIMCFLCVTTKPKLNNKISIMMKTTTLNIKLVVKMYCTKKWFWRFYTFAYWTLLSKGQKGVPYIDTIKLKNQVSSRLRIHLEKIFVSCSLSSNS